MIKSTTEFAQRMQDKINLKTEEYGNFEDYNREDLIEHLELEIKELRESNYSLGECIDVSNLCYMIWATELKKHKL